MLLSYVRPIPPPRCLADMLLIGMVNRRHREQDEHHGLDPVRRHPAQNARVVVAEPRG